MSAALQADRLRAYKARANADGIYIVPYGSIPIVPPDLSDPVLPCPRPLYHRRRLWLSLSEFLSKRETWTSSTILDLDAEVCGTAVAVVVVVVVLKFNRNAGLTSPSSFSFTFVCRRSSATSPSGGQWHTS